MILRNVCHTDNCIFTFTAVSPTVFRLHCLSSVISKCWLFLAHFLFFIICHANLHNEYKALEAMLALNVKIRLGVVGLVGLLLNTRSKTKV